MQKTVPLYSECDLVALLVKKDIRAFSYLYDNYSAAMYGVIFKAVGNEETSQDLLQDVFVKIWKNIDRYDAGKGRLFTWMLNIARNTSFDHLRTNRHEILELSSINDIAANNQNVFFGFDNNDVKELVSMLKSEQKIIIELVYWQGYTHEEAAERLKLPLGTIKTRVRTALRNLRFILLPPPTAVLC
ncbi:RNA polymerase sigma factor [Runella sp.]|uniref:RNA polymerase sigma factor n=1 Tax=Runella sp. TaxID=1960881 RepID=UPI003D0A4539